MITLYTNRVMRILKRPLTQSDRDTCVKFLELGYSVNYTAEYLR